METDVQDAQVAIFGKCCAAPSSIRSNIGTDRKLFVTEVYDRIMSKIKEYLLMNESKNQNQVNVHCQATNSGGYRYHKVRET